MHFVASPLKNKGVTTCVCLQANSGNVSCRDSLLRSDRLMLINSLFINLKDLWTKADCESKSFASP